MLKLVVAIGSLYSEANNKSNKPQTSRTLSEDLWRSGGAELERFVSIYGKNIRAALMTQRCLKTIKGSQSPGCFKLGFSA
jgi:hypothetical protein